ncbi:MAG: aspartyl protease family protein [Candidatus Hydrothermarchaeota archaeon]|nr:aspartyl protease family protein [Candidatus Hydrothermarchaeota archaeon]
MADVLKLKNRGKKLLLGFLVDSGADFPLIPKSAADYLRLERKNLQFADSASGGKVPYYLSIATFEISGHEFKAR